MHVSQYPPDGATLLRSDAMLQFYEIRPGGPFLCMRGTQRRIQLMNANKALVLCILFCNKNDSTEIKLLML